MAVAAGSKILADDALRVVARGSRPTSTGTTTTVETAALRVDSIPVYNGRCYEISMSSLIADSSVNGDDIVVRLRYTTDGTNATATSTILGGALAKTTSSSGQFVQPIVRHYYPTANETLSICLTFTRAAGTGNVSLVAATGFPIEITVKDLGTAPSDTGVSLP